MAFPCTTIFIGVWIDSPGRPTFPFSDGADAESPGGAEQTHPGQPLGSVGDDPSLLEPSRRGAYDRTNCEISGLDAGPHTPAPIPQSPIDPRDSRTMTFPRPCPFR